MMTRTFFAFSLVFCLFFDSSSFCTGMFLGEEGPDLERKPLLLGQDDGSESGEESEETLDLRTSRSNLGDAVSEDEEEISDFVLIHGSQHELEGLRDQQIQELQTFAEEYLTTLRLNPKNFGEGEMEALNTLFQVEGTWRNHFVWSNLEKMIHKTLFALTTNKSAIRGKADQKRWDPLWLHGGPVPLENEISIRKNATLKTLFLSLEEGVLESLHAVLLSLMGYQIYEFAHTGQWDFDPKFLLKFYFSDSDEVSYLGIIKTLHRYPVIFGAFSLPLIYALSKTIRNTCTLENPDGEEVTTVTQALAETSPRWDSRVFSTVDLIPFVSLLLNFHPMKRKIPSLTSAILWQGGMDPEVRTKIFNTILQLAETRTGYSQMVAIEALSHLTHGMNLRNLRQGPHNVEDLLHLKLRAFQALQQAYQDLPYFSLNKLRTAVLLWSLGQSPSWRVLVMEPIIKIIRGALYIYTLYGIGDALKEYFECSYKYLNNFTWAGGTTPYADNYKQACFNTYLSIFNKVPGQPASTLVSLMPEFVLDPSYTLFNLSGAAVSGEQVAGLLNGLRQYQPSIHLTQFDLSGNAINTPSGMRALMDAFKNITQSAPPGKGITLLNLSDNKIGHTDDDATLILGESLQNFPFLETLDLSGNGIGTTASNGAVAIGRGLHHLPHLTTLNLSGGNYIGESGAVAIGESLRYLSRLKTLDLSGNWIVSDNAEGAKSIGEGLRYLPHLTTLDLSGNWIGSTGSNGTKAIGKGLRYLPQLTTLDLSRNSIGYYDKGVVAIGEGLQYLPQLTTLDLSGNNIAHNGSHGIVAIGQGLRYLPHLKSLDLLDNAIGTTDSNGTVALGEGLQYLPQLRTLDLSENWIGSTDSNGTKAIGENLQYLTHLTDLDLSANWIGNRDSNGTKAIGEGLQYLPQLTTLDLSGNWITSGFDSVTASILHLKSLAQLFVQQTGGASLPPSQLDILRKFWGHRNSQTDVYALVSTEDVKSYVRSLPNTTHTLNLTRNFPYPSAEMVTLLFEELSGVQSLQALDLSENSIGEGGRNVSVAIGEGLRYLPHLTTLDLSRNSIGYYDKGVVAIGEGLQYLSHLTTLDLSRNSIGYYDKGVVAIGEGLRYLPQLTTLDLSGNDIAHNGSNGTKAIGESLRYLSHLQTLDLSENGVGQNDDEGTVAIGEGLRDLPHLTTLDLSRNWIGINYGEGTVAIGEGLRDLPHLTTLDLSGNLIGQNDDEGTKAIGEGLRCLPHLISLDLSMNHIGQNDDEGTKAIGEGLQYLPHLTTLGLSHNKIGYHGDNGTIAIAQSLPYLSHLQTLDLSGNQIGEAGATHLFAVLPQLICNGLEQANLYDNNFKNISWTQAANALQGLYASQVYESCAANLCSGKPIHVDPKAIKCQNIKGPSADSFSGSSSHAGCDVTLDSSLRSDMSIETSGGSLVQPFYMGWVKSVTSWLFPQAWLRFYDQVLDSALKSSIEYSQRVVEGAPSYFSPSVTYEDKAQRATLEAFSEVESSDSRKNPRFSRLQDGSNLPGPQSIMILPFTHMNASSTPLLPQ